MRDRPDELKHQLATLWRAARTGVDAVKEIAVRSSQAGRLRFDIALLQREREQLLVQMGRSTCDFLDGAHSDADLSELPEDLLQLHARIRDVDGRIQTNAVRAADNAFGAPRGYEPEAAVDYGDEDKVEDSSDELRVEEVRSVRTDSSNGGSSSGSSSTNGKRKRTTTGSGKGRKKGTTK